MYIVLCLFESRMRCRQACDGHAERRAAHVVQTCEVAELHRRRFAAVFAADAKLQVRTGLTAQLRSHLHQLANAVRVQTSEGIALEDLVVVVGAEELASVVTGEAERHLGQVVRAEGQDDPARLQFRHGLGHCE